MATEGTFSTWAPVRLDILIHVIKVIIDLLHKVSAAEGTDGELIPVVSVLVVPDVAGILPLLLLFLGILKPATLVPHLQGAPRHHSKTLNIILQPRSLAAAERIEATDSSAELALLVLLDDVEGLAGLAAVLVKHDSTGTGHRSLECLVIIVNYTVVNKI